MKSMNLLRIISVALLLLFILILGCRSDKMGEPVAFDDTPYVLSHGDFPPPPVAEDNRLTKAAVALGRMLFYEKALSGDGTQACADCHRQEFAFTDDRQFSIGIDGLPGGRHSMSAFNLAYHRRGFFWDGRSPTLRHQALQPIQDPLEMNETLDNVRLKLQAQKRYRDQFVRAFGDEEVTDERMGLALEQFMTTILSYNSRYDRYLRGEVELTDSEARGKVLFFAEYDPTGQTKGGECFHCHGGFNFTNDQYQNNGLDAEADFTDLGHYLVTGNIVDRAKFKTPTLRNIAVTAPYMHDGRFNTLEEVIEHYNTGVKLSPSLDFLLHFNLNPGGLRLDEQDIADLIAFLHTLTDESLLTNPAFSNPF
jgi:cytochrome c peroxidase